MSSAAPAAARARSSTTAPRSPLSAYARASIRLREWYAMPGTDLPHCATRCLRVPHATPATHCRITCYQAGHWRNQLRRNLESR
eukprot:2579147-Rhodomonas_salina.1